MKRLLILLLLPCCVSAMDVPCTPDDGQTSHEGCVCYEAPPSPPDDCPGSYAVEPNTTYDIGCKN